MTFTATPQPSNVPPRVRLDIDTDDVSLSFTSLTIARDGKAIREQPFAGSTAALTYDYEAPFGASVTYDVVGMVTSYSNLYTTSWPNLTGWSTSAGSPGVTGGKFYSTSGLNSGSQRTITLLSSGRLVIAAGMLGDTTVALPVAGGFALIVSATGGSTYLNYGASSAAFDRGTGAITVSFDGEQAVVVTTAGTWVVMRGNTTSSISQLQVAAYDATGRVPAITVQQLSGAVPFSATTTTTLDVDEAWLIHPSAPSLSCSIDSPNAAGVRFVEASSGESNSSQAQSAIHRPVGRRRAVVVTSGPRQADEWTLTVIADTIAAKNDLRAMVDDQTPLLLRSPAYMNRELPDDWYSVGDVAVARPEVPAIGELSFVTLPLTPVDEPIVRQGALWTYGTGLIDSATYADSRATYPTYLDRLAGPAA